MGSNYGWPATEGATADPSFRSQDRADDDGGRRCSVDGNRASTGLAVRPSVQDELVARLQRVRDLLELLVAMGSWPRCDLDDGGGRQGGVPSSDRTSSPVIKRRLMNGALPACRLASRYFAKLGSAASRALCPDLLDFLAPYPFGPVTP